MSPEASAGRGRWNTSFAEYQRGILDAISDPDIHTVVVQSSAQVGKTEMLLNAVGYFIHQDPSPILVVQPNVEPMGETFAKDRLAPMIRDTPALKALVADPKSRDSSNTIAHKKFPGGHVTIASASAPASLASRPIRVVLLDEVDKYPPSVGKEGDVVERARARTKTFWNRKIVLVSTPSLKGFSRIEQARLETDMRSFWVPCLDCGEFQVLKWANVRWEENKPETARYACEHCGSLWDDGKRHASVSRGEWRAERVVPGTAGFHLSEIYSPWVRLSEMATAFLAAKHSRSQERMQQFVNESLGETWEVEGESVDGEGLKDRGEEWSGIPDGVLVRTVGIDVQQDRLEVEHVGWGDGEESWSLEYRVIPGDPEGQALWNDLERYLQEIRPHAVCIDSGGSNTQAVYKWTANKLRRRIYAIKGVAGAGKPVWPQRGTATKKGGRVFLIGVDAAKDSIYARLKLTTPGPGYCHFPRGRSDQYFEGLTCETVKTRYAKGFPIREYVKPSGARNEPLDCRVYAYAALCSLSVNWALAKVRHQKRVEKQKEAEVQQEPTPPVRETPPVEQKKALPRQKNWIPRIGRWSVTRW